MTDMQAKESVPTAPGRGRLLRVSWGRLATDCQNQELVLCQSPPLPLNLQEELEQSGESSAGRGGCKERERVLAVGEGARGLR